MAQPQLEVLEDSGGGGGDDIDSSSLKMSPTGGGVRNRPLFPYPERRGRPWELFTGPPLPNRPIQYRSLQRFRPPPPPPRPSPLLPTPPSPPPTTPPSLPRPPPL